MRFLSYAWSVVGLACVAACAPPSSPPAANPPAGAASVPNMGELTGKARVTTPSGILFESLQTGSGPSPKATDTVKVHYRGTFPDGHIVPYTTMIWANFSHWTEEDRHAVLVYLRNLPPVRNKIPDAILQPGPIPPGTIEGFQGFKDYAVKE